MESGFSALDHPEERRESEWLGNRGGWQYELAALRTRAERPVPAVVGPAPVPAR